MRDKSGWDRVPARDSAAMFSTLKTLFRFKTAEAVAQSPGPPTPAPSPAPAPAPAPAPPTKVRPPGFSTNTGKCILVYWKGSLKDKLYE